MQCLVFHNLIVRSDAHFASMLRNVVSQTVIPRNEDAGMHRLFVLPCQAVMDHYQKTAFY